MAQIVIGIGTSHSPLLVMDGCGWELRAKDDRRAKTLYTLDGRRQSYEELVAERGEPFIAESMPERFEAQAREAEAALDELEARLVSARPDVVLVIGDDQEELFGFDNMPAFSVYCGDEVVMKQMDLPHPRLTWTDEDFWAGYAMDAPRRFPGAPQLAGDLVRGLVLDGVDVSVSKFVDQPERRAFGHAYGFIQRRLMKRLSVPMLPVLLNTYFPPNNPTASRCLEIGAKMAKALAASPMDARVAIIASGGLSHFLCEEEFDLTLMRALRDHDLGALAGIGQAELSSGTSEVRNWITMAGAIGHLNSDYQCYIPVYRTAVGTGIGLAFAAWS